MGIQRIEIDRLHDDAWQHLNQAPLVQILVDLPRRCESDPEPKQRIELKDSSFRPEAVSRSDYFVSGEADARLFVRHVAGSAPRRTPVLLIHGGSPGSEVIFDLPIPGYSLAEDFAGMGLDAFLMDARGWGQSTPAPNTAASPGSSRKVVADIAAVVDDVLRTTGHSKLLLFGHASGGHWAAMYASERADKVAGLVLLNSMYSVDAPWKLRQAFEDPGNPGVFDPSAGPYRLATADGLLSGWNNSIPTADKTEWRDPQGGSGLRRARLGQ